MSVGSQRVGLGRDYAKVVDATEDNFLIQVIGAAAPVRVVAVGAGGAAPATDTRDYFILDRTQSGSDALVRGGLEGADIYVRSDSETRPAYITFTSGGG